MAKKIRISLSEKSIQNAINEVRKYQRELISKNEVFVRRLAELGIPVIVLEVIQKQNLWLRENQFYS